jgi:RNA polymerase sigma-70 factor (ECF subfamily)
MAELATRDRDDALDIVQDAMLVLARRYAGRPESEWRVLFFRVLDSRIQDWHRRTRVRSRWRLWLRRGEDEESDPLEAQPDTGAPTPEHRLALDRAAAAVEEALSALPPRQRQAFLLRAWEGLDVAETARAMGCAAGSVKVHYARALAALRGRLAGHWP